MGKRWTLIGAVRLAAYVVAIACLIYVFACEESSKCHEVGDAVECRSPNGAVTCQEPGEQVLDYYPCNTDSEGDRASDGDRDALESY